MMRHTPGGNPIDQHGPEPRFRSPWNGRSYAVCNKHIATALDWMKNMPVIFRPEPEADEGRGLCHCDAPADWYFREIDAVPR